MGKEVSRESFQNEANENWLFSLHVNNLEVVREGLKRHKVLHSDTVFHPKADSVRKRIGSSCMVGTRPCTGSPRHQDEELPVSGSVLPSRF